MAVESLQATLPRVNPLQKGNTRVGELFIQGSGAALTVYDATQEQALQELIIQNCGQTIIKVCFNDDAAANKFNIVLPKCTADDDGLSAPIHIDMTMAIGKVSIFSAGASMRVAVTKVLNNTFTRR